MRYLPALLAFLLALPVASQVDEVRGNWIACPNVLKNAGVCDNTEAIFYVIAPIAKSVKARDATCWKGGYQDEVDDGFGIMIPNPEPCGEFAVRYMYGIWVVWHVAKTTTETAVAASQAIKDAAEAELGEVVPEG